MRCIVTAGPTFEPIDAVRRLTNFSTGRLGTQLAVYLHRCGDEVLLLRGEAASYRHEDPQLEIVSFTTADDLARRLKERAAWRPEVIFHAAAVCDYKVEEIILSESGVRVSVGQGKIPTGLGQILLRLSPTPKILPMLRDWFPDTIIVGWKFEVDGDRRSALQAGMEQVRQARSNFCVVNGPAYGTGFAVVTEDRICFEASDDTELFGQLRQLVALTLAQRSGA